MNSLLLERSRLADAAPTTRHLADELEVAVFAELYETCASAVLRYAWSLVRDRDLAEDICSEAFLRAWESRGSFRGAGKPLSWLLSITRNCALTEVRRRSHGEQRLPDDLAALRPASDEGAGTVGAEHQALCDALGRLTEGQRSVVFLRFFAGLRAREVGSILGLSSGAVRATQCRALSRLRRSIEGSAQTRGV